MHTTQEARTTMAEIGSSITPQQRAAALKAIPSHAKKAQTLLDGYFQNSLSGERFKAMAKQALEKLDALHAFDLGVRGADPKDELRLHVLGITYGEVLPIGLGKTQAYTRAFTARVRTPAIARAAIRFPTGAFSLSEMRLDWIYNFALNATKYVMATSLDLPAPTLAVLQTIVDNAGAHFGPTEQLFAHWVSTYVD